MTKRKSFTMLLLSAVCAICAVAFMFLQTNVAKANVTPAPEGTITNAEIKTDGTEGIRFRYEIDKSVVGELSNVLNLGIEASLPNVANSNTIVTEFYKDGSVVDGRQVNLGKYNEKGTFVKDAETGDKYLALIYFHSIGADNINTDITVKGYIQLNGGEKLYTQPLTQSINSVARSAYDNQAYGEDDDLKAIIEKYLNKYQVTYTTAPSATAVQSETVYEGSKITATSTLDGFEFGGWFEDGVAIDAETYTVEKATTLVANYKKSVAGKTTGNVSADLVLDFEGATVSKIVFGTTTLDQADYSLDANQITIAKSALIAGTNSVKVYVDQTTYYEYSVLVVDPTQTITFSEIDLANIVYDNANAYKGDPDNEAYNRDEWISIAQNPEGKQGSYYKLSPDAWNNTFIRIFPTISKDILSLYAGGAFKFDVYLGGDTVIKNSEKTANVLHAWADLNPGWNEVECSVEELIAFYDDMTLTSDKTLIGLGGATSVNHYLGNFRIVPLDTTKPLDFAATITGTQAIDETDGQYEMVDNPTGQSGTFYKAVTANDGYFGAKFTTKLGSAAMAKFEFGSLEIIYKIEYDGADTVTSRWLCDNTNASFKYSDTVTTGEWHTFNIPTADLAEFYANETVKSNLNNTGWPGRLMGVHGATGATVYIGGFTIKPFDTTANYDFGSTVTKINLCNANESAVASIDTPNGYQGSFYKVSVSTNNGYLGIKVLTSMGANLMNKYASINANLVVTYMVDTSTATNYTEGAKVKTTFLCDNTSASYKYSDEQLPNAWYSYKIPMADVYACYTNSTFTDNLSTAGWPGRLIGLNVKGATLNFGGFVIEPAGN